MSYRVAQSAWILEEGTRTLLVPLTVAQRTLVGAGPSPSF